MDSGADGSNGRTYPTSDSIVSDSRLLELGGAEKWLTPVRSISVFFDSSFAITSDFITVAKYPVVYTSLM